MKRVIVLSSLVTSAVWLSFTAAAFLIAVPAMVEAQVNQVTAGRVTVLGEDGTELVTLGVLSQGAGFLNVKSTDGKVRAEMLSGASGDGHGGFDPASAGVKVDYPDGRTEMARIGTLENAPLPGGLGKLAPLGSTSFNPAVYLRDSSGNIRFLAFLDDAGNASIHMLDANGNVTWSAP